MVIYNKIVVMEGEIDMTWKDKVVNLMATKKINQKELARLSGITEASVSRYLANERKPRIDVIINFAKALDVTVEYLLDSEESNGGFQSIATAIARDGGNLTPEEKNQLIALILGKDN